MSGVFLLPTRDRISNLRRFLNASREMGVSEPGWILVNRDEWARREHEYRFLQGLCPPGWVFKPVEAQSYGDAIRAVWDEVKGMDWVGLVSDDLVPCTSIWDKQLIAGLTGWNFVSSNDGKQAPARMHGATVFSGDLLRAVGGLFPPKLKHIFHDDFWETLHRETNCGVWKLDVMVKHLHEFYETGVRGPSMDPNSDLWKHDQAVFEAWRDKGEKDACVARIRDLMASKGLRQIQVDFSGIRLMLGTPCGSGRYESSYVVSLFHTMQMMRDHGVVCQWAEEKYTADISLARAKIFSAFVRSDCTHLLMVDDDMSWEVGAVVRLFSAKKDFVAVAGPKKRYPLQFAANYTDDEGNPLPLIFDNDSGTMEVGEIGAAFVLLSRRCAEKMIRAYPELEYIGVTQEPEWAVFNPLVINKRFHSEDFAFCRRWRMLGEHVHFVPDIPLGHTGMHQFRGAFSETISNQPIMAPMAEAAD